MLTYTFTTREKFLLAFVVILFGGLAWYYFIFSAVQLRVDAVSSDISTTQQQIDAASAQVLQLETMRTEIEQFKTEGRSAVLMPPYDNTKALMDALNNTIGVGKFKLSTDELNVETLGQVKRGMVIEFRAASYESAREILDALAEGEFPCSVESVSITDEAASRNSTSESPIVVRAHLTFYEEDVNLIFESYAVSDTEE